MQEGKEIQESLKMEKEEQIPKKEVQKEHKIQEQVQGVRDACSPVSPISLIVMQFLGKIFANNMLVHSLGNPGSSTAKYAIFYFVG